MARLSDIERLILGEAPLVPGLGELVGLPAPFPKLIGFCDGDVLPGYRSATGLESESEGTHRLAHWRVGRSRRQGGSLGRQNTRS